MGLVTTATAAGLATGGPWGAVIGGLGGAAGSLLLAGDTLQGVGNILDTWGRKQLGITSTPEEDAIQRKLNANPELQATRKKIADVDTSMRVLLNAASQPDANPRVRAETEQRLANLSVEKNNLEQQRAAITGQIKYQGLVLSEENRKRDLAKRPLQQRLGEAELRDFYANAKVDGFDVAYQKLNTDVTTLSSSVNTTSNSLTAFAASLYDTSGAALSYADQLRKLQGLEGLKQTGKRDKATEKMAADQRREIDRRLGLKTVDTKLGRDDLNLFGVKDIKELQAKVGAPVDGVVGPITTRAALEFLKAANVLEASAEKIYNGRAGLNDGRGTSTGLFKSPTAVAGARGQITGTSFDTATGRRFDDKINPRPSWEIENEKMVQSKIASGKKGSLSSLMDNVIEGGKTAILGALTGAEDGITSAGQAAATAIQNAVNGAGSAIVQAFDTGGSSAASKIANAMSNASVTVNTKVTKPLNTPVATKEL
jgi:hypothetical protein